MFIFMEIGARVYRSEHRLINFQEEYADLYYSPVPSRRHFWKIALSPEQIF